MSLNQEHIATLRQEIPMITRQIQLISGPEFTNTVPEVAAAKQALEAYKAEAERHVAEWDRAHNDPQRRFRSGQHGQQHCQIPSG